MRIFLIVALVVLIAFGHAERGRLVDWFKTVPELSQIAIAISLAVVFTTIAAVTFGPAIIEICQWAGLY